MRTVTTVLLSVVTAFLLVVQPLAAAEQGRGRLVDPKWLEEHLTDPDLILLDASPAQIYAAKHIPGAINVDYLLYGAQEMPLDETQRMYQSWGISPGRKIVIYDQGGTYFATRYFFALHYYGFPLKNLYVLDGGLSKWEASSLPVTKEPTPAPAPGSFKIGKVNEEVRVRLPEFLAASGDRANHVLLEALTPSWHYGEVQAFDRAGHIPGAVLLPSADFFNADKTFKSADEIRKMLAHVGIRPEQTVHSHCGGGVSASVPWFALKFLVDYPRVKLYTESQIGWLSDPRDLPYWTYDVPSMMRDVNWLKSWGGQAMRMYGVSKVSVIDIRPPEAFSEGHLPFALNVPIDVFRTNLGTPEKLAGILGAAGVDPSYEAVVVSGSGLSKDAALAYLMLEKLGQQKISVLTDSSDKWTRPGYAPTKDATVVAPKKNRNDVAIPPTTYAVKVRKDVVVADPQNTAGVYPKLFVASGAAVPAGVKDAKVVHVPYTELLNPDGTPKAAKDIWNILAKAGVTRYAELMCVSDDPAEAAANYYVLRLMGFPDVKVLAM